LASKPDASIKQGHLLVKKRGGWNRRWFVVTDGQMFIYKNWKVCVWLIVHLLVDSALVGWLVGWLVGSLSDQQ
jgi:hypothetical protein